MFVITGGGSGIGAALARALDARGCSVLIIGRRAACLAEVVSTGQRIQSLCADVASVDGRQLIVQHLGAYDRIQGLVHNAGVIEPIAPMRSLSLSAWSHVFATNLEAPYFLTQALFEQLRHGRVLHIGSGAAYFPVQGWAPYCISKAALAMLTRCWQLEHPEIALTSVMPGIIDTDMQTHIRNSRGMDEEKQQFFLALKAHGKLLSVDTVASFLTTLLLDVEVGEYVSKEWDIYTAGQQEFPNV